MKVPRYFNEVQSILESCIGNGVTVDPRLTGRAYTFHLRAKEGISATRGYQLLRMSWDDLELVWHRLIRQKIVRASELPARMQSISGAILDVLCLLPFVGYSIYPRADLFLSSAAVPGSDIRRFYGVGRSGDIRCKGNSRSPRFVVLVTNDKVDATGKLIHHHSTSARSADVDRGLRAMHAIAGRDTPVFVYTPTEMAGQSLRYAGRFVVASVNEQPSIPGEEHTALIGLIPNPQTAFTPSAAAMQPDKVPLRACEGAYPPTPSGSPSSDESATEFTIRQVCARLGDSQSRVRYMVKRLGIRPKRNADGYMVLTESQLGDLAEALQQYSEGIHLAEMPGGNETARLTGVPPLTEREPLSASQGISARLDSLTRVVEQMIADAPDSAIAKPGSSEPEHTVQPMASRQQTAMHPEAPKLQQVFVELALRCADLESTIGRAGVQLRAIRDVLERADPRRER